VQGSTEGGAKTFSTIRASTNVGKQGRRAKTLNVGKKGKQGEVCPFV